MPSHELPNPIVVTLPGRRRVDAHVRGHVIHTDQPERSGGEDTAPSPFELFLSSLAACAGVYVQGFCARRDIPTEGIRIVQQPTYDVTGALVDVSVRVELPPSFPQKYEGAVRSVVEQCSVKRVLASPPSLQIETVRSEGAPVPSGEQEPHPDGILQHYAAFTPSAMALR